MVTRGRAEQGGTLPLLLPRENPLLMLIDGHAQVYRAWHAINVRQHLSVSKTGEDVTAVFGFTNAFLKAIQEWSPTHCAIAFDLPAPTFRHKKFPDYKAQRPASPPELRAQFQRIKQLMRAFSVPIFELEGYEADDVIGTLCRQAEEQRIETLILTGDTDTFQLVSPWVRVALQRGIQDRETYDEAGIRARYGGLSPEQQPDLKALKGDSSDNIPGVPGVGAKTAVKLVVEYGSLEGIYKNIDEVQPPRIQEALRSNRERAFLGQGAYYYCQGCTRGLGPRPVPVLAVRPAGISRALPGVGVQHGFPVARTQGGSASSCGAGTGVSGDSESRLRGLRAGGYPGRPGMSCLGSYARPAASPSIPSPQARTP